MTSRAASADGKAATKPPRQRPKARDVKERAKGKRLRRPPPVGHRQALPDQLEDPNEYGVRVGGIVFVQSACTRVLHPLGHLHRICM